jgi:hypothetical protein
MKSIYRVLILGLAVLSLAPIAPCQTTETVLYAFKGNSDGTWPVANLLGYGGALYGTTYKGCTNNYGTHEAPI